MDRVNVEVVKIGGSLLARAGFVSAFRHWLAQTHASLTPVHRVLLVGGGPLVDVLRGLDATHPLSTPASHWGAVELMELSGRLVADWLPELPRESDFDSLQARCLSPGTTLFLAGRFLRECEPHLPGEVLPMGWHVTSDSIAARLAELLRASRLILVKSAPPPGAAGHLYFERLAAQGFVDSHFPTATISLSTVEFATLTNSWHLTPRSGKPNST